MTRMSWRNGNRVIRPSFPPHVFKWNGPGRKNGYGYGEHVVKRHLNGQGFQVIINY